MVARCRLGEAEAILSARRSRVDATGPLRAAMAIARRLGAAPLEAACASVGRFARIDPDTAETPTSGVDDAPAEATDRPALDTSFGLTDRELEVLRLIAQGLSNRRIGDTPFITESTAGVHVSNILGKLGVASRVEAAAIAVRVGLSE
jgi:DNA-binding NarL/FixJ family response regulator